MQLTWPRSQAWHILADDHKTKQHTVPACMDRYLSSCFSSWPILFCAFNQLRIVAYFKTIRDRALQELHIDVADLQAEQVEDLLDDVCVICELAEKIQELLPRENQEAQDRRLFLFMTSLGESDE